MNRDTENLYYNQRFIIDNRILTEPRTWKISKINRISNNGTVLLTCAQDKFNEHTDYIEKNESGDVIGMWADYYSSAIEPKDDIEPETIKKQYAVITYSGVKPEIKIGGSYKKFTVDFYDIDNTPMPYINGLWSFAIDGMDVTALVNTLTQATSTELNVNQIKAKFPKDDSYIGKVLDVTFTSSTGISATIQMELKAL